MHSDSPKACPFCRSEQLEVLCEWPLVLALLDRYPVSDGHAVLITKRHVPTWFDASAEGCVLGLGLALTRLTRRDLEPSQNTQAPLGRAAAPRVRRRRPDLP